MNITQPNRFESLSQNYDTEMETTEVNETIKKYPFQYSLN